MRKWFYLSGAVEAPRDTLSPLSLHRLISTFKNFWYRLKNELVNYEKVNPKIMLRRRKSKSNWLFFTICVVIFYKKFSQVMKRKNRKNFDDFFRNSFFGQKVSSKFWKCINAYFYIRWMIFVIKLHSTKFLFSLSMTLEDFVKSQPDLKGLGYYLFF